MFKTKKNLSDYIFITFNTGFMLFVVLITLYPFWFVVASSFNDPVDLANGPIFLWPRVFSTANYEFILQDVEILRAAFITVARTVIGSLSAVLFTAAFSYAVSKRGLIGRKIFITMALITLYFSGGLIPTYIILTRFYGLHGNFLVYILPNMFNAFNAIIMITFFKSIPSEMEESARIDGANDLTIFVRLVLPVSTPILATITLFNGVFHWNSWFDAMLYGGRDLMTLQQYMVRTLQSATIGMEAINFAQRSAVTGTSVRYATMVITAVPIIMIYPFLQRYFVKGIMIGSLKE